MTPPNDKAWGDFWAQATDRRRPGGCLPQGAATIEHAQKAAWTRFISSTPKGARILDVATGDARVLHWVGNARPDLKRFGIDAAPVLPTPPKGCKVRAGVPMEKLPFKDSSFQVVTSQFGLEYGDIDAAAAEIARVLTPGGRVGLMVHRGDGPILAHNLRRSEAICWVIDDQDVLNVARQALAFPAAAPLTIKRIATIAADGARLFGANSPAWEIAEAARRALGLDLRRNPAVLIDTLAALADQARHETSRISALQQACTVADDRDQLLQALAEHGLRAHATSAVPGPDMRPFADFIELASST